ncbi:MAG: alpha/beta hydrolase [Bellilinea sp.]|nr:MAG: alpha/beta hydrolase [Bellilinea sp.]
MTIIEDTWVKIEKLNLHLYLAGEGEQTVVLLHGGGTDSAWLSWQPVILALSTRFRVVAPDLPGYGKSDTPRMEYTLDYYLDVVRRLLDHLEIERSALVGVSMGGGIAIGFTLTYPARVHRLVPVDSYGIQRKYPGGLWGYYLVRMDWLNRFSWWLLGRSRALTRASLQQIFHDPNALSETLVNEVYDEIRRPQAGLAFRSFQRHEVLRDRVRTCFLDRLNEIQAETLFIHGENDRLVPLECAREAHARLPNSRLEIIPACGHWPQREKPDEFNRILLDFLLTS